MISVVNKIANKLFDCGKHRENILSNNFQCLFLFPRMFTICKEDLIVCLQHISYRREYIHCK